MDPSQIKALVFDVFGTVVDWRTSLIDEAKRLGAAKCIDVDWETFVDDWQSTYRPMMDMVRHGVLSWTNLDQLHRMGLDQTLAENEITGLTEEEKDYFNRAWHRLTPWPDSVPGLNRLKARFILGTMSNGNVACMVNMAKFAGLPWDCSLGAELVKAYKPDPRTYKTGADLLGLHVGQVMMVAAHQYDLLAAGKLGLKTAFVPRPLEEGPSGAPDPTPDPSFDLVASNRLGPDEKSNSTPVFSDGEIFLRTHSGLYCIAGTK